MDKHLLKTGAIGTGAGMFVILLFLLGTKLGTISPTPSAPEPQAAATPATTPVPDEAPFVPRRTHESPEVTAKDPKAAAQAVLAIITTTRADTAFVTPARHAGLWNQLESLEKVARPIAEDPKAAADEARVAEFNAAVAAIITFTHNIAVRTSESPLNQQKSHDLIQKFELVGTAAAGATASPTIPMGLATPAQPVRARNRPPETPNTLEGLDSTHDTHMGRLAEAQIHIKKMLASIEKLPDASYGGFLEKTREHAKQTSAHLDAAIAWVKAHPESNPLKIGGYPGLPTIPTPWPPPQVPAYARYTTLPDQTIQLLISADRLTNLNLVTAFSSADRIERTFMPDSNANNVPQVDEIGGSKFILFGDSVQLMTDLLAALDYAHTQQPAPAQSPLPASMIAPKESLTLEISPASAVFTEGTALALNVTFRNTGAAPLRLPNNAGLYGDWMIRLESRAGKITTGGILQFNGTGTATAHPSRAIAPNGTLSIITGFQDRTFNFLEGDLSFADFQKAAAASPLPAPARGPAVQLPQGLEFPEGTYKVTLTARFPNAVTLDADTTPIWKYDAITSNTVEVKFARLKPEDAGSISGTVVGPDGKPLPGAAITWIRPEKFNPPPVGDSGYAKTIANNPNAPTPTPIRPTGTYAGGISAGTSDANGAFSIKNLAPGTYVITVASGTNRGSLQPIEVKAGAETKLDQPVKAILAPMRGGSGGGVGG